MRDKKKKHRRRAAMKRRLLGRTGLDVPEIGFGCGPTAGLMVRGSAAERRAAVKRALDLGVDYFDTAPVYGETVSEANLGGTLRALHAKPIVATKVALEAEHLGDIRGAVIRSVEASVARLGVPITLIQLHNRVGPQRAAKAEYGTGALLTVDDVLGHGGVAEAFRTLRDSGLVRFFGCSGYGGEPASVARLIDSGAFDTIIVNYSMLNRTAPWHATMAAWGIGRPRPAWASSGCASSKAACSRTRPPRRCASLSTIVISQPCWSVFPTSDKSRPLRPLSKKKFRGVHRHEIVADRSVCVAGSVCRLGRRKVRQDRRAHRSDQLRVAQRRPE